MAGVRGGGPQFKKKSSLKEGKVYPSGNSKTPPLNIRSTAYGQGAGAPTGVLDGSILHLPHFFFLEHMHPVPAAAQALRFLRLTCKASHTLAATEHCPLRFPDHLQ